MASASKKSLSKTPAPAKDRIYGSKVNPVGSAASKKSAKSIKLDEKIVDTLTKKKDDFNAKHRGKVTVSELKAVFRRGLGAYSSSHRPTISGGRPNTRTAWAYARVNKFLEKKAGKPVKKAYVQDDDLLAKGGTVNQLIVCRSCGWNWDTSDSDESDKYVCHKCGFDNRTFYDSDFIGQKMSDGGKITSRNIDETFKRLKGFNDRNGTTINEIRRSVRYRDVVKDINKHNFYISTKVEFKDLGLRGGESYNFFEKLKQENPEKYQTSPKSGSEYIVFEDKVYRKSNHWGRVASCEWLLKISPSKEYEYGQWVIGLAYFKDFEINYDDSYPSGSYVLNKEYYIIAPKLYVEYLGKLNELLDDKSLTVAAKKMVSDEIQKVKNIMKKNGLDKPYEDIEFGYDKGGQIKLLAPNGKPSNLTPEQYSLVRTPKFKAWFGDWENDPANASKVVDENGEPLICYHGTNKKFSIFQYKALNDYGFLGVGFYFTNLKNWAEAYATEYQNNIGEPIVYEVFLNIRKPYKITKYDSISKESAIEWTEHLKNIKKDGVVYINVVDDEIGTNRTYYEWVAFYPNQIKLADGSNVTFDPNNPDIRYEDGGSTEYGKVVSASSRFRPKETIFFNPPLMGLNGAKLIAYEWSYTYDIGFDTRKGEEITVRVSDWTQADVSADTGRGIVHKYTVEFPNGEVKTVSSESVPVLLGYEDRKQPTRFPKLATASKTLAKQKLELEILNAKKQEREAAKSKIIAQGYPELKIVKDENTDRFIYLMGDGRCFGTRAYNEERIECVKDSYIKNRLKEIGIDVFASYNTYDLENRIQRQERKIQEILKTQTYKHGGNIELGRKAKGMNLSEVAAVHGLTAADLKDELAMGIETEMEHTTLPDVARSIALDHLYEHPKYYTILKEIEKDFDGYYEQISRKYAKGGETDEEIDFSFRTPTGEPTKLNYLQQILVRTTAFKNYFGDWQTAASNFLASGRQNFEKHYENVSKTIDSVTLEPVVLYHGTVAMKEFFQFDTTRVQGMGRPYGYFAYNKEYSENFLSGSQRGVGSLALMYQCFIDVKNPFFALTQDYMYQMKDTKDWINDIINSIALDKYGTTDKVDTRVKNLTATVKSQIGDYVDGLTGTNVPFWALMSGDLNKKFKNFMMSHGYDGIFYSEEIFLNNYDPNNPAEWTRAVVIFNPKQVKLADGRNTEFNPMEVDMRYEQGGSTSDVMIENQNNMTNKEKLGRVLFGEKYAEGGTVKAKNHDNPNDGKKGGLFVGRSHADGGIKAINVDTGQLIEVEGQEVIITKDAVNDPTKREFDGQMMTNKQILSKINQSGGGVSFEKGGETESNSCGCSGKKYKFGGELIPDYEIINLMQKYTTLSSAAMNNAKMFTESFINKMK